MALENIKKSLIFKKKNPFKPFCHLWLRLEKFELIFNMYHERYFIQNMNIFVKKFCCVCKRYKHELWRPTSEFRKS